MTKKEPSKEKIREGKDEGGGQGKQKSLRFSLPVPKGNRQFEWYQHSSFLSSSSF